MRSSQRTIAAAAIAALSVIGTGVPAKAAAWVVDTTKSTLGFIGTQSGSPFDGHFTRWQADVDFDPANPVTGHVLALIDMASATTGDRQKDESLPQPDWFDIKSFPRAKFEATGFRPTGAGSYEALGTLTIRGIQKPAVLPFSLDLQGDIAHAKGRLTLVRSDYGVGQGAWSTGQYVGLDVAVTVDLVATRK